MIPAASSSLPFRTWVVMVVMVAWLAAALCPRLSRADAAAPVPAAVRSFFKTHCLDCHDDATATAKLSLESLLDDFTSAAWVRVHDRIEKGDMPPADAAQPTRSERDEITGWLAQQLTQAATARQRSDGRVALRRMNRREYEHTMQDLLGIAEPIGSMLPEDSVVHGFDTTSSGLDTSATHLLRYQQAADRGLDAALPPNPATARPRVTRWTGAEFAKTRGQYLQRNFIRIEGDAFVFHSQLDANGDQGMHAPSPPGPGRYRIRAAVRAVNSDGRPVTMLIARKSDRFQLEKLLHVIDYREAFPDRTTVVDVETDLGYTRPGVQTVYFVGVSLPTQDAFTKSRGDQSKEPLPDDFSGPGLAIEWAEMEGPLDAGLGERRMFGDIQREPRMPEGKDPPANWTQWPAVGNEFKQYPLVARSADPHADADRLIRGFLPLAFRRPVPDDLAKAYVGVANDLLDRGQSYDEAMRAAYRAILCSPHFTNYVEEPGRLDDSRVAARLARFLWSSMPDDELFAAAAEGRLSKPSGLHAEAERMLADPKAARFVKEFTDQWLDLGRFLDMKPDEIYVECDPLLMWSAPLETRKFFAQVLAEDLPVASFLHADWTMLNERLARHYGIPGIEGAEFRTVDLRPEYRRGGLITQMSFLKLSTNASYTSPIKRGTWVLERIIGTPPQPPPPNVKAIEPDIRGATTIREQLALHKNVAVCASCHRQIDPPGFALENYDVVGGWRDRYRVKQGGPGIDQQELPNYPDHKVNLAKPVEADGETADGRPFRDIDEYKRLILANPDQLARNMVEKLVVYATGAAPDFADRGAIEQIVHDTRAEHHGLRSLLHAVIQSPMFLCK